MDDKLRRLEHRDSFPLNHIVKTVQNEDLENFNQYKPFITIFELSQEEIDMLPEINECNKGLLFTKLWEERGITLKRQKNSLIQTSLICLNRTSMESTFVFRIDR
jgi:hypothetical protein